MRPESLPPPSAGANKKPGSLPGRAGSIGTLKAGARRPGKFAPLPVSGLVLLGGLVGVHCSGGVTYTLFRCWCWRWRTCPASKNFTPPELFPLIAQGLQDCCSVPPRQRYRQAPCPMFAGVAGCCALACWRCRAGPLVAAGHQRAPRPSAPGSPRSTAGAARAVFRASGAFSGVVGVLACLSVCKAPRTAVAAF